MQRLIDVARWPVSVSIHCLRPIITRVIVVNSLSQLWLIANSHLLVFVIVVSADSSVVLNKFSLLLVSFLFIIKFIAQ